MKPEQVVDAFEFHPEDEGAPRLRADVARGVPAAWQLRERYEEVLEGCGHEAEWLAQIFTGCVCGGGAKFWDSLLWVVEVERYPGSTRGDWYQFCPDCRRFLGVATSD
jgi:hypothetical protein